MRDAEPKDLEEPQHGSVCFRLVPCQHFYLAVEYRSVCVVALCKLCRKRFDIVPEAWEELKREQRALDKPARV
jgi:hypothetical protein